MSKNLQLKIHKSYSNIYQLLLLGITAPLLSCSEDGKYSMNNEDEYSSDNPFEYDMEKERSANSDSDSDESINSANSDSDESINSERAKSKITENEIESINNEKAKSKMTKIIRAMKESKKDALKLLNDACSDPQFLTNFFKGKNALDYNNPESDEIWNLFNKKQDIISCNNNYQHIKASFGKVNRMVSIGYIKLSPNDAKWLNNLMEDFDQTGGSYGYGSLDSSYAEQSTSTRRQSLSFQEVSFVGIDNPSGTHCYMNAEAQTLSFYEDVLPPELKEIVELIERGPKTVSCKEVIGRFAKLGNPVKKMVEERKQQDPDELHRENMKCCPEFSTNHSIQYIDKLTGNNLHYPFPEGFCIPAPDTRSTMSEIVNNYQQKFINEHPAGSQNPIFKLPFKMYIQLHRSWLNGAKNTIPVDCTLHIEIESDAQPNKCDKFDLQRFIVHQGHRSTNGHYIAYVKRNETWYKISDSNINRIDDRG